MKKLTMFGIITCVVLLLAPVAVMSAPAGPPDGLQVTIVNPLPVPVTDSASCAREPVHFMTAKLNLSTSYFDIGDPVPADKYLVIETVSVSIFLAQYDILDEVNLSSFDGPYNVVVMWIPTNPIEYGSFTTERHFVGTISAKGIVSETRQLKMYVHYLEQSDPPKQPDVYYSVTGYYVDKSCPSP